MPLKFLQRWPKSCGFEIYGKGPSYVVSVEKGSMAYKAGLVPGDQILEVDGRDVTAMSSDKIKALARTGPSHPPALEVVSCLQTTEIKRDSLQGYGMAVLNDRPVRIGAVDYAGPAYQSGLRAGDVILEVNNRSPVSLNTISSFLYQGTGKLTLLTIPVGRTANMVTVDKGLSRVAAPDSRLHKARDLHAKLDAILGNDYVTKMAVVSGLKRYAEDRDVSILCDVLNDNLKTSKQRSLLKQIRLLIPPVQRGEFDDAINILRVDNRTKLAMESRAEKMSPMAGSSNEVPSALPVDTAKLGQTKIIQVIREGSSFGFVIKACSPAYIESVDEFGAAERAGLQAGDFILKLNGIDVRKCDHDILVQMLQDSGSAPTLEILRGPKGSTPSLHSWAGSSSSSSTSSHDSLDNIMYGDNITDLQGNSFVMKMNFLLTPKEKSTLKKSIRGYDLTRNIVDLYNSTSRILDSPSKKMLWSFIFIILSQPHREYVSHRVSLPWDVLMEVVRGSNDETPLPDEEPDVEEVGADLEDFPASFQKQLEFLLTSKERVHFNNCLKDYSLNTDLSALARGLESILDTPSKRILWRLVLPRLTDGHREVMRGRLDIQGQHTASAPLNLTSMDTYIGSAEVDNELTIPDTPIVVTEDDMLYGRSKSPDFGVDDNGDNHAPDCLPENLSELSEVQGDTPRDNVGQGLNLVKELEETKKAVQEVRDVLLAQGREKDDSFFDENLEKDLEYLEARRYVTVIPVGHHSLQLTQRPLTGGHLGSEIGRRSSYKASRDETLLQRMVLEDTRIDEWSDDEDTSQAGTNLQTSYSVPNSLNNSDNQNTLLALRQLDDAMADEQYDDSPRVMNFTGEATTPGADDVQHRRQRKASIITPPPPPPPPLPPSFDFTANKATVGGAMNVKRINWEKLDNKNVENTIWERLNDQDLKEVVRFLELETQFSIKPSRKRESEKKKEILIMDRKKAYNISILLGHLKMTVGEVIQALYQMDDEVLTPELISQLLAFAPSQNEISKYAEYKGETKSLTKPDQFAYQISKVENYEQRLQALLFKSNFTEKSEEMRENLENIRMASQELRDSKKLARLLEVILAMGNYLNKGNNRVGQAAGFRITFLTQLDITKTSDQKSSFLHVLADAAYTRFPDVLSLSDELPSIEKAAKASMESLNDEILALKKGLKDASTAVHIIKQNDSKSVHGDRFLEVMVYFISEASDEIQSIVRMQTKSKEEFASTLKFFGENPDAMADDTVFEIFAEFIKNFERAHRHNLMLKRH